MRKLAFLLITAFAISCQTSTQKSKTTTVKQDKKYFFAVAMYTYPDVVTSRAEDGSYKHEYKKQANLGTGNIEEHIGDITEEEKYMIEDKLVANITNDLKIKDMAFKSSASIYGIDTRDRVSSVYETKLHVFDSYKDASIAHRMAVNNPRDFLTSKQYYPEQQ